MADVLRQLPADLPTIGTLAALLATYLAYRVFLYPSLFSPLKHLAGPPRETLLFGNLPSILREPPGVLHCEWAEKYGGVVRYTGLLGEDRLVFTDAVALNHILMNAYNFPKPAEVRGSLARILGKGVLFAEGQDHRRQRKIMNPAFSPSHLRDIAPTFFACTYKLRDAFHRLISESAVDSSCKPPPASILDIAEPAEGEIILDVSRWLSRVTLDVIGESGFGYEFGAVEGRTTKLAEAFAAMFNSSGRAGRPTPTKLVIGRSIGWVMSALPFDVSRFIPMDQVRRVREGLKAMEEQSEEIVAMKKKQVQEEGVDSLAGGKDLMSLLLRSNMSGDSKTQLTDTELQGQMTTMLLAGHETSSTTLTWLLYRLSSEPQMQARLRAEVREARRAAIEKGREEPSMDELEALPYLDAVVREILRLESPVPATIRTCSADELVPLSTPIKARNGSSTISEVIVPQGTTLFISVSAINKSKKVWGDDAESFRPERWLEGKKLEGGVGVYSNMLTFLAGPRACIGYKFAVLEVKTILAVLIDDFEFSPRNPGLDVERRSAIVTRPLVVGEEDLGFRMPLRMRRAARDD